jgi:hypothetical protein
VTGQNPRTVRPHLTTNESNEEKARDVTR